MRSMKMYQIDGKTHIAGCNRVVHFFNDNEFERSLEFDVSNPASVTKFMDEVSAYFFIDNPNERHVHRIMQCADVIEGLTNQREELLGALKSVNKLISEAAAVGFDHTLGGDWCERLYHSQQRTSDAIKKAEGISK